MYHVTLSGASVANRNPRLLILANVTPPGPLLSRGFGMPTFPQALVMRLRRAHRSEPDARRLLSSMALIGFNGTLIADALLMLVR